MVAGCAVSSSREKEGKKIPEAWGLRGVEDLGATHFDDAGMVEEEDLICAAASKADVVGDDEYGGAVFLALTKHIEHPGDVFYVEGRSDFV
jgi:hypothetical protein